ncbi:hypothetical protein [Alteromonas sp. BMJM2]|uniref:hypothetical protein n=1 Tax=Alteromonas sp. BMJM2 TaxID=2954241 RepID=UPI0022B3CC3B|nr:hypothetical protein [Alteromonas sp. BMJM2]
MAKITNRAASNAIPSIANNNRGSRNQKADAFANLVFELPNGEVVPASRVGLSLTFVDEPSSQMQAVHNYMIENPEEAAKNLKLSIRDIHVVQQPKEEELDIASMFKPKATKEESSTDETTQKLKSLMTKTA